MNEKKSCQQVDFAVIANHRLEIEESDGFDKNLDLARELKKLWNMKMSMLSIVFGNLGIVPNSVEKNTVIKEYLRKNRDHPNHIIKLSLNNKMCLEFEVRKKNVNTYSHLIKALFT